MPTERHRLLDRLEQALLELTFVLIDVQKYFQMNKVNEVTLGFRTAIHDVWELVFWAPRHEKRQNDFQKFCQEAIQRVTQRVKE